MELVQSFSAQDWNALIIVDDGSGAEYRPIFDATAKLAGVQVIRHAVNLGKGAALKSGMNLILCAYPEIAGVVTVDADGQHDPLDTAKVRDTFRKHTDSLVLGVRSFDGTVPLRSKLGNRITRTVLRAVLGQSVADTQTGLRAIPRNLMARLLKVPASGYEFELEMLVAVKHLGVPVVEQPIRTIYQLNNPSSHFRPLWDSLRIYSVLLRFTFMSVVTAVLDNVVFAFLFGITASVGASQIGGRSVAVLFNYLAVRKAVFLSEETHRVLLPRYLLVVLLNGLLSYAGIGILTALTPLPVVPAKILVEALLFFANFLLQRDFVFSKRAAAGATDWDQYYQRTPGLARFTRRYTESVLIRALRQCPLGPEPTLLEFGGANSCFLNGLTQAFRPRAYHVVDQNQYGLDLLARRTVGRHDVVLHHGDVLSEQPIGVCPDVVISVGLIEHFAPEETERAIASHFRCLQEGGHAVISFPTPTWLYRMVRGAAEVAGAWAFPDERPLPRDEVRRAVAKFGCVVWEKTLWPLMLTQHLLVIQKRARREV